MVRYFLIAANAMKLFLKLKFWKVLFLLTQMVLALYLLKMAVAIYLWACVICACCFMVTGFRSDWLEPIGKGAVKGHWLKFLNITPVVLSGN